MLKVAVLSVDEDVRIDQRRLDEIVAELGRRAAHELIGAALEQLAIGLRETLHAAAADDCARVAAHADRLSRLAWQVGLVTLAAVAVDAGQCAERGDRLALQAVLARLERIGNRSLTEIWDGTDPP